MLRKPGHKFEKILILLSLVLIFSGIAFALIHFVDAFILVGSLGFYLLIALFTYGNLSMRTKSRNAEKEMDVSGISPDQAYDALLSFFSKKHGYNKMKVLYSSKPELIVVKLNSWTGMGRGFYRPPGSVQLQISPSESGCKTLFKFDFSGFRNAIYGVACILVFLLFGQIFGSIHVTGYYLLYPAFLGIARLWSLGIPLCVLIILLQIPFMSTLETKTYLRGKVRECLTQCSRKSI